MNANNLHDLINAAKLWDDPIKGTAKCDFGMFGMPKTSVSTFLPDKLKLSDHPFDLSEDEHPVVIMANDIDLFLSILQLETLKSSGLGMNLELELKYQEFIIGIPYVQFVDSDEANYPQGSFIFLPTLYLNNLWGVMGGQFFYGFNKVMVDIDNPSADAMDVSILKIHVLQKSFTLKGQPEPHKNFPNFNLLSELFAMKTVSFKPDLCPFFGTYILSMYYIYDIEYIHPEYIQPGCIDINNEWCIYLPKKPLHIPEITTFANASSFAFRFNYNWTLSCPDPIIQTISQTL